MEVDKEKEDKEDKEDKEEGMDQDQLQTIVRQVMSLASTVPSLAATPL